MNLSRKHGKHTWRRHKVACVSACRHRSAQPLKIKCILLLKKKKHSTHSCLFWLSLPHLLLSCFVFFFVLTEHAGSACSSYVCRGPRRDLCPPPPFFLFSEDASSPNPQWRCSLTPRWVSTEHSYRSCQTPPLVRRHGRDECHKSLTSEPHVHTHNMPWFFPRPRLQTAKFTVIFTSFSPFSPLHKALLSVTEDYLWGPHSSSVCHKIHIFDFVTRFAHKQKCLTAAAL